MFRTAAVALLFVPAAIIAQDDDSSPPPVTFQMIPLPPARGMSSGHGIDSSSPWRENFTRFPTISASTELASTQADSLLSFDPQLAELVSNGKAWQLRCGNVPLKEFTFENDGREAVQLLRDLHLNQHGTIGKPRPVVEYWLSDGQAPRGPVGQRRLLTFDPHHLRAEEVQGQWCVRDPRQILFSFGAHADEARKAIDLLQAHGFNRLGMIGRPRPVLMYFLAVPEEDVMQRTPANNPSAPADSIDARRPATARSQEAAERAQQMELAAVTQGRQLALASLKIPEGEWLPLDWRQIQLRQDGGWKLVQGNHCLADFGDREQEARDALRVVQSYRFTEQWRIGDGPAPFSLYLVNGQPPRGVMIGVPSQAFHAESLSVRKVGDDWTISDGERPILAFGDRVNDAHVVLKIIQRQRFDHVCQVGGSQPGAFTFLVRAR